MILCVIASCKFKRITNSGHLLTSVKQIFIFACIKPAGKAFAFLDRNSSSLYQRTREEILIVGNNVCNFALSLFLQLLPAAAAAQLAVSPPASQLLGAPGI